MRWHRLLRSWVDWLPSVLNRRRQRREQAEGVQRFGSSWAHHTERRRAVDVQRGCLCQEVRANGFAPFENLACPFVRSFLPGTSDGRPLQCAPRPWNRKRGATTLLVPLGLWRNPCSPVLEARAAALVSNACPPHGRTTRPSDIGLVSLQRRVTHKPSFCSASCTATAKAAR